MSSVEYAERRDPPLRHYLRILRRRAWLIVLAPAVAAAAGIGALSVQQPVYRASMKIVTGQAGGAAQPVIGSIGLTQTMTNLLESDIVARQVISELGLRTTPVQFIKDLHISTQPDSSVLTVSYDSHKRAEPVEILGAVASVFGRLVNEQLGAGSSGSVFGRKTSTPQIFASVFDPPHLQPGRVSPNWTKVLAFALGLGLALGVVLAIARETLDDSLRGVRDIEEAFGVPVIGTLPTPWRSWSSVSLLYAALALAPQARRASILISSPSDERLHRAVGLELARNLAQARKNVIYVEAHAGRLDHRATQLGYPDSQPNGRAVEEALFEIDVREPRRPTAREGLGAVATLEAQAFRTRGSLRGLVSAELFAPAALLQDGSATAMLEQLRSAADYVVVDGPPLAEIGPALSLGLEFDIVLLVVRDGKATPAEAERSRALLDSMPRGNPGIILLDRKPPSLRRGYTL